MADPSAREAILSDIASMNGVVFIHGGGDVVTEYSRRMGVEPRFVVSPSGVRSRYTSAEELEVYVMVMAGKLNKEAVAWLNSRGVPAVGVSGVDCGILRASRKKRIVIVNEKGRRQVIPGGYTGKIHSVNTECLRRLLDAAGVVVVSPLALGDEGEMLNVDGDQAAAAIAMALRADALVLLTDVPGVLLDGRLVRRIPVGEAEEAAARTGKGMNRKILMAAEAVRGGVSRAIIAPGNVERPVARALSGETGTLIE
jgi:acetylglutamate/LysW-gamma-L-alpha-aminoadipate kinase